MPRRKRDISSREIEAIAAPIAGFFVLLWIFARPALLAALIVGLLAGLGYVGFRISQIKARKAGSLSSAILDGDRPPILVASQEARANSTVSEADLMRRLNEIDWYQFEQIAALLYRKLGYSVERRGGANPDGGIDLVLSDASGRRRAVQIKQWRTWKVGVKTIREFIGAMKVAGIENGIFITLHDYSLDAMKTARANGIETINGAAFARLLQTTDAKYDPEFLLLLDGKMKTCPKCDQPMVLRTAVKGANPGSQFWGCSTYPRCRFTLPAA